MNRITEITRMDISDVFINGIKEENFFEVITIRYPYYGRLREIDFLKRLYDLRNIPSIDKRYSNAEEEIIQHTVNNNDYSLGWILDDDRFQLKNGDDEFYLKFLCMVFHPVVRDENVEWKLFLNKINELLINDGYELYVSEKVSNREVYGWRMYRRENKFFVPYSQRHKKEIIRKKIQLSINRNARNQIYQILQDYNASYQVTNEYGLNYNEMVEDAVFSDMRHFYTPKCFNEKKEFVETSSLKEFVNSTLPFYIFDLIEFFGKHNPGTEFEEKINTILRLNDLPYKMNDGKIGLVYETQIEQKNIAQIEEAGLRELLQEAAEYYNEGNKKIAVEKIWDAYERLKTYYSPTLDKKKSINKIVEGMSGGQEPFREMFNKEFSELTILGNTFRIRHHEVTKIDIKDERHFEYFYKRCMALVSIAIQYLQ